MNEHSRTCERSEQYRASKYVSSARERVNGRASGPVLTSRFLVVLNHCVASAMWVSLPNRPSGQGVGIVGGWRVGRERISGSAAKGGWTFLLFQEIVVSNEDSYDQSLDSKSKQQIQRDRKRNIGRILCYISKEKKGFASG